MTRKCAVISTSPVAAAAAAAHDDDDDDAINVVTHRRTFQSSSGFRSSLGSQRSYI